jgi:hypothetical protein
MGRSERVGLFMYMGRRLEAGGWHDPGFPSLQPPASNRRPPTSSYMLRFALK